VPTSGVLKLCFACLPETRNFASRKSLYEMYGFTKMTAGETEVCWRTSISEVPRDVELFIGWLLKHFQHPGRTFESFCQHRPKVTLASFEETLVALHFGGFNSSNPSQRVEGVFRFLNFNRESGLTPIEWQVCLELWRDLVQVLEDFAHVLHRRLAHPGGEAADVLRTAWEALAAAAESQRLDAQSWEGLVKRCFDFDGQATKVFQFLDSDDGGLVTAADFEELRRFLPRAEA